MAKTDLTRRTFLGLAASAAAMASVGCPEQPPVQQGAKAFMRSGRGLRVSKAAKLHNHNFLYATRAAALANPAHLGDKSKVVSIDISQARFNQLFGGGAQAVDLRKSR